MGPGFPTRLRSALTLTAIVALAWAARAQSTDLVTDVRAAIGRGDRRGAEALVSQRRAEAGQTPDVIVAVSWLGRGALAARDYATAERYGREAQTLAVEALRKTTFAREPKLATALGAAIETQAQLLAAQGQRASAVQFLNAELKRYRTTPIGSRLQKNLHLLSLEGTQAPALTARQVLGPKMPDTRGKPTLLFFWAHWCPDCKAEAPIIAELARDYGPRGLVVIGPTRHYGSAAGGAPASPAQELAHIDAVRQQYYGEIPGMSVPVSDEDSLAYGMDATPTLVLTDRRGRVVLYHPGKMSREELEPVIRTAVGLEASGPAK